MPIVNPSSRDPKPADWRWAWQEFQRLRTIATKAKIDTSQWKLEFPSKVQRIVDPRWKLTYTTVNNQLQQVYLGSTGRLAGDTIKKMIPMYSDLLKNRPQTAKRNQPIDPLFDIASVKKALEIWNREVVKVRSLQDQRAFEARYPKLLKLMQRRAGYLDMSLKDYLTSHPHSTVFPTPPRTCEEYESRKKAYNKQMADREAARKQQREDHGPDWIPTL